MKTKDYDDTKLEKLIRALDPKKVPVGRLGVLAGESPRGDVGPSNAEIGAKHELGDGVQKRSWLRVPLIDQWAKYLEEAGAFKTKAMLRVIKEGSFVPYLTRVMIVGERVVQDAFDSCGFGKWKPSDMTHKKTKQTLVETQQLRNSVTSEVK